MSNSKRTETGVEGKPCVVCGGTEYDIYETTEVADGQDSSEIGNKYMRCFQCKSTYDYETDERPANAGVSDR